MSETQTPLDDATWQQQQQQKPTHKKKHFYSFKTWHQLTQDRVSEDPINCDLKYYIP